MVPVLPQEGGLRVQGRATSGSRLRCGVWFQGARLTLKPLGAGPGQAPLGQASRLQHAPPGVPRPFAQACPSRDTEAVQSARQGSPGRRWAPPPQQASARPPGQE